MLRHTFCHIDGVGPVTEAKLWAEGIVCWDDLLSHGHRKGSSGRGPARRLEKLERHARASKEALEAGGIEWFARSLPSSEMWRLFPAFRDEVAYVDIETTGLTPNWDVITVVAVYAGGRYTPYIQGKNLREFPREIDRYKLLVTFNGAGFDIPFLRTRFPNFAPRAHLDLRWPLKRLGFAGGLKSIERRVGYRRPGHLVEVDGFEAVRLWRRYQQGETAALDRLVEYAGHDVRSLEPLAELVAERMPAAVGFPGRPRDH